jgi:hypothetical protein
MRVLRMRSKRGVRDDPLLGPTEHQADGGSRPVGLLAKGHDPGRRSWGTGSTCDRLRSYVYLPFPYR